eukprot:TRINITY_DN76831_c0_g1_i1.p1 TRINITY_DN76831_c0_g1~~TRINITY_DN76831_c0_g1_i1.p1  ORF type:complete len:229 (-),score=36.57 TRINITY_DN76831_c0_g1_i1:39-725(-)
MASEAIATGINADEEAAPLPFKEEDFEPEKPNTKLLVFVVFLTAAIPVAFLGYEGWGGTGTCAENENTCIRICRESYANAVIIFQSDMLGEKSCVETCETEGNRCRQKSDNLITATIFLLSGICCHFCVMVVFPALTGGGMDAHEFEAIHTRPAYAEPKESEEVWRKKEAKKKRFFWQDPYKEPSLVEIDCSVCGYKSGVDMKWLKGKTGGIRPAICERCKSCLAGLI